MSNVRYFSHDRDALSDSKIEDMRSDYGMEGYGLYWALIEAMCHEPDLSLPYTKKKAKMLQMKFQTNVDMMKFIDCCIKCKLFETDKKTFWSNSLRGRLAFVIDLSEKRSKAAQARWNRVREESQKGSDVVVTTVSEVPPIVQDTDARAVESDDELIRIQQEQNEVFDAMRQAGFDMSSSMMDKVAALFAEYGKDNMLYAISECVESSAVTLKYLKGVLRGVAEREANPPTQEKSNNDDEVRWLS